MRVAVIDNGGQWTHREYRMLRDLDVSAEIVPNTRPWRDIQADGVVLSGGALSLEGTDTRLGAVADWIDDVPVPVLGICVGHQFLGRHFGGKVGRAAHPEFGRVTVEVDGGGDRLFEGLPEKFTAWENHNDHIVSAPPGWKSFAHSETCPVQAMAHPSRPIWGVQFHPEVEHTEGGQRIFENFVRLCRR
ncbi:MAG TPA: GMP synthase subunit A [Thermoplasmata archaeon]|nr:GMP synthase subunit A [Thermoplasmata archaeon]